ncbi:hypothetical protein NDU88_008106, partial [Pleurodeles waltl]
MLTCLGKSMCCVMAGVGVPLVEADHVALFQHDGCPSFNLALGVAKAQGVA